ncbi:hypothetical protein BUALT_Bualt02G0196000 [Buddleja alternifolia]|uniref:SAC domain-containing protein n=1 Tax=Buddleja alternifolia TaxID=168488 RepID=A0AAV6Y324_9LAMI|nr:hypothetical protein BUALT_Bualt02G0196000 [Buddleja alternifolia]
METSEVNLEELETEMETKIHSDSTSHFKLWSELELKEFTDKFVIKSVESPNQGFSISRFDGNIDKINADDSHSFILRFFLLLQVMSPSGNPSKVSTIYGVVGTVRLLAGTYVLIITSRKEVGTYLGFPVFLVTSMTFLSCNEASRFLTSEEKKDESYFMTLLKIVESTPGLYYSYGTDITLNLQRRCKLAKGWMSKPIWKQGDPRFIWNKNIFEELIENKLDGFIIPLLQGNILTDSSYLSPLKIIDLLSPLSCLFLPLPHNFVSILTLTAMKKKLD